MVTGPNLGSSVSGGTRATDFSQRRVQHYWVAGLGLVLGYTLLQGVAWLGSIELHTIIEVAATLLAFFVGATAMARYYADRNSLFLFVGAGFLGTSFFDGYHAAITSSYFASIMPSSLSSLIPWSWLASRQFLALMLLLSVIAWLREERLGQEAAISPFRIYALTGFLMLGSAIFFAFVPLPQGYFDQLPFHRPEEFLPALFFGLTLWGFLKKGAWRSDVFEHWLVLALIVNLVAQVIIMPFSGLLFDLEFDLAHILKIVSYACVAIGLLASVRNAYSDLDRQKAELELVIARFNSHRAAIDEHAIVSASDSDGKITYVNDRFCSVSGYNREELLGQEYNIVVNPKHGPTFLKDLWQTILSGKIWHGVVENVTKDGAPFWVQSTILPTPRVNGDGLEYISIHTDITDQKEAQAQLKGHWDLLMTTFESFPGGLVVFDEELKLVLANTEYYHQFGLPPHKARPGTHYEDILYLLLKQGSFGRNASEDIVEQWIEKAQSRTQTTEVLDLPGKPTLKIIYSQLDDGGLLLSVMDISEHREREQKLADAQEDLNIRVCELQDARQRFEEQAREQVGLAEQLAITQMDLEAALARAEESEAKFKQLAHHDNLTGLANRALFNHRLADALEQSKRSELGCALLLLDLDRFKEINDTLGHPTGDKLLQEVARRLKQTARSSDIVARLGGDEFAIIATNVKAIDHIRTIAQKFVDVLAEPFELSGQTVQSGTSIGVATFPEEGDDPDLIYKRADLALYLAKSDGRGTWRHFDSTLNAYLVHRQETEMALRQSMASGSLRLYCQPQVHLSSNKLSGVEFIPSWRHPNKGWMLGREFMPLVESTDLILKICEWTFEAACKQMAQWHLLGMAPECASVRVPALRLQRPGFAEELSHLAKGAGAEPAWFEIQIMEGAKPIIQSESVQESLKELKAIGFNVALADLGTGQCLFGDLQNSSLDRMKIHRSLVEQICDQDQTWAIVQMLIHMAECVGVPILADGVSNESQIAKLALNGCTDVQGPYVGEPLTADAFEARFSEDMTPPEEGSSIAQNSH